jgi:hypothetical protein
MNTLNLMNPSNLSNLSDFELSASLYNLRNQLSIMIIMITCVLVGYLYSRQNIYLYGLFFLMTYTFVLTLQLEYLQNEYQKINKNVSQSWGDFFAQIGELFFIQIVYIILYIYLLLNFDSNKQIIILLFISILFSNLIWLGYYWPKSILNIILLGISIFLCL